MSSHALGLRLSPVVAAAAVLALAPGPNAAGARAGVPVCAASRLATVYVNTTAGAGSRDGEYGFRNRSAGRCRLRGYPAVQMLKLSGAALSTTDEPAPGAYGIAVTPVTLAPGAVAYFGVHYAASTGYGTLRCPTSAALKLTAPGTAAGLTLHGPGGRIQPYGGSIPHLHCGILHVSALTARRFQ